MSVSNQPREIEAILRETLGQDVEIPESLAARLRDTYASVQNRNERPHRGKGEEV